MYNLSTEKLDNLSSINFKLSIAHRPNTFATLTVLRHSSATMIYLRTTWLAWRPRVRNAETIKEPVATRMTDTAFKDLPPISF